MLLQVKQEAAAVGNIQHFSGRWDEINRASVELRSNQVSKLSQDQMR